MNQHELDVIAMRVMRGDYGDGSMRRILLEDEGYDFKEVQNRVDEITPDYEQNPEKYNDLLTEISNMDPQREPNAEQVQESTRETGAPTEEIETDKPSPVENNNKKQPTEPEQVVNNVTVKEQTQTKSQTPAKIDYKNTYIDKQELRDAISQKIGMLAEQESAGKLSAKEVSIKKTEAQKALECLKDMKGEQSMALAAEWKVKSPWTAISKLLKNNLDINIDDFRHEKNNPAQEKAVDAMDKALSQTKSLSDKDVEYIKRDTQYHKKPQELEGKSTITTDEVKELLSQKKEALKEALKTSVYDGKVPEDMLGIVMNAMDSVITSMDHLQKSDENAINGILNGAKEDIAKLKDVENAIEQSPSQDSAKVVKDLKNTQKEIESEAKEAVSGIKGSSDLVKNSAVNTVNGIQDQFRKSILDMGASALETFNANHFVTRVFQKVNAHSVVEIKHHDQNLKALIKQLDKSNDRMTKLTNKLKQYIDKEDRLAKYEFLPKIFQKKASQNLIKKIEKLSVKNEALSNAVIAQRVITESRNNAFNQQRNSQIEKLTQIQDRRLENGLQRNERLDRNIENIKDNDYAIDSTLSKADGSYDKSEQLRETAKKAVGEFER